MNKTIIGSKVIVLKLDVDAVPEPKVMYWCKPRDREEAHVAIDMSTSFPEVVARLNDLGYEVGVVV